MRKFFTLLWLLFPVGVVYYHFNEGQAQMAREKARDHLVAIRELERAKEPDWPTVVEEYDKLAAELPQDERPSVRHQIRLAKAKAKIEMLDVAGAIADLAQLLKESAAVDGEDGSTTRAIRETLGKAYFYATALLKATSLAIFRARSILSRRSLQGVFSPSAPSSPARAAAWARALSRAGASPG